MNRRGITALKEYELFQAIANIDEMYIMKTDAYKNMWQSGCDYSWSAENRRLL